MVPVAGALEGASKLKRSVTGSWAATTGAGAITGAATGCWTGEAIFYWIGTATGY